MIRSKNSNAAFFSINKVVVPFVVKLRILELLALASRIVFAISFDTITVTVYLVVVSTIIIFEELLFVKLLVFLGLLVLGVFDVVVIFPHNRGRPDLPQHYTSRTRRPRRTGRSRPPDP